MKSYCISVIICHFLQTLTGSTGWLLQGDDDASSSGTGGGAVEAWSSVMARAANDEAMCKRMGRDGR
jgi:hypothetical protein